MYGAIKAQFINAESQDFNIEGRDITAHYLTVIDVHANNVQNRYTQLKVRDEAWRKMGLDQIANVKSFQGKQCEFHGTMEKSSKRVRLSSGEYVTVPTWEFYVVLVKEAQKEVAQQEQKK